MKRIIPVSLILACVLLIAGCGSAPAPQSGGSDMPDFVLNPPTQDDVLYGIGSAKLATQQLSMTMADSRARQSVAFQLRTNVQAMITDYARQSGTMEESTALELAEVVGRQLVNVELSGAKVVKREVMKDGTFWVLMSYSKPEAAQTAAKAIDSESAKYAEFKAKEARGLMDQQLSRTDTKPEPVTN
jgi:hypothetical protein